MATLRGMPHQDVPLVDPASGRMTAEWRLYFVSREKAGTLNLSDVSSTAPANNQVLIWNSTTGKWTPGAN